MIWGRIYKLSHLNVLFSAYTEHKCERACMLSENVVFRYHKWFSQSHLFASSKRNRGRRKKRSSFCTSELLCTVWKLLCVCITYYFNNKNQSISPHSIKLAIFSKSYLLVLNNKGLVNNAKYSTSETIGQGEKYKMIYNICYI